MSNNSNPVKKDAYGHDAIFNYLPQDGLGVNGLPDSEKYKRGIKENTTGRTRTLGVWMSCPKCGISKSFESFIPNDYGVDLSEDIERKECPDPECKGKNFSVIVMEKDTVFYPREIKE
jgi:hypothetical protein